MSGARNHGDTSAPIDVPVDGIHEGTANDTIKHISSTIVMDQWVRLLLVTATCLLLSLSVFVAVRLLSCISHTLLIFSLGGLLAYAAEPIIVRARIFGLASGAEPRSRAKTTLLVFTGFIGVLVVGLLGLSLPLTRQVEMLAADHIQYEENARLHPRDCDTWLADRNIRLNLEENIKHPPPNVKGWGELVSSGVLSAVGHIGKAVVEGFITALIALYFLIYCNEMREGVLRNLPHRLLPYARYWMDDVNRILGGFVRGQLLLAVTIGAMAAILCLLLGIKLWLLIGLFVVVAALIPVVGPFIGAVPAVIAALLSPHAHFPPVVRIVVLVASFGIINEVGSKILYPKLVGAALGLHEVLVLFILFAGVEVAGLTGVLFAAPLTALGVVTLAQLYRLWQGMPPVSLATEVENSIRHPGHKPPIALHSDDS